MSSLNQQLDTELNTELQLQPQPLQQLKKSKFTIKEKKELKLGIDNLSLDGKREIFKIIKHFNEKYSENKNGILLDISRFNEDTLNKIKSFLDFSNAKSNDLTYDELKRDNLRSLINKV